MLKFSVYVNSDIYKHELSYYLFYFTYLKFY